MAWFLIARSMPRDGTSSSWLPEAKVMFFGAIGAKNIQNAIKRRLEKLKPMNFNCFEVTGIVAKRFLGVPYAVVSAHSRHIQQSCYLDGADERRTSQRDAEQARA
jgi:hypothetical protein